MSKWWRHLGNAYEVKADVVCLPVKLYDPYLSALEVVSRLGAIQMQTFTFIFIGVFSGGTQEAGVAGWRDGGQQDGDSQQLSQRSRQRHSSTAPHQLLQSDDVTRRPAQPRGKRRETYQGDLWSTVWQTSYPLP